MDHGYDEKTVAIEALRDVARALELVDAAGVVQPHSALSRTGRAVIYALDVAGQLETVEWKESISGKNQAVWQGRRLRDHAKPSIFPPELLET